MSEFADLYLDACQSVARIRAEVRLADEGVRAPYVAGRNILGHCDNLIDTLKIMDEITPRETAAPAAEGGEG